MPLETLLPIVVLVVAVVVIFLLRRRSEARPQDVGPTATAAQSGAATTAATVPKSLLAFAMERSVKVLEHHLVGEERQVLERWLGASGGEWTGEQTARFSAALQRFLWDGEGLSHGAAGASKMLRGQYPTVAGTPLDIDVPPDVRAVFAKLMGSDSPVGAN